jgi:hypothetical protein
MAAFLYGVWFDLGLLQQVFLKERLAQVLPFLYTGYGLFQSK